MASAGFALGTALQLQRPEIAVTEAGGGVRQESEALDRARAAVRARLERRAGAAGEGARGEGAAEAARAIAAAHLELLDDPELLAAARGAIAQGKSAAFAWRAAVRASAATLAALTDARLRERVDDLLDLESQVLLALEGSAAGAVPPLPAHAIVIARELLPSQLAALDATRVAGICMAAGGPTSHASILAAAMGIPALVALGSGVLGVRDGTALLLDAAHGVLEIDPPAARLAAARAEVAARGAQRAALEASAQRECRTADGTRIEVFANIGSLAEAQAAVRNGAEGCGLLRTEFLFLDRQLPPTEAEQSAEYQRIAAVLGERPFTIRTLDAGGDKPIAYLPLPAEDNPALGLRGVRTSLAYPQLLRTQLRAVLAVRSPHCRLLLPMITDVDDIHAVRVLLEEVRARARPRRSDQRRRHDRDAGRGAARRSHRCGCGFPLHRHERSHSVHPRHGPRPPAACRAARCAASGGAAPHRAHRGGRARARSPCGGMRGARLRAARRRAAGRARRAGALGRTGRDPAAEGAARQRLPR